ncbi:DNA/RNA nuclease SfsA [bacterium]|nr:DNA/RNA nuclease SfsA [bacterium]
MECQLEDKSIVLAHIPNTGSMKSLLEEGNEVFLEKNNDEKRKLKYTCHFMRLKNGAFVCVNTHIPNILVYEAIINNKISIFSNFSNIKREFKYGEENSKIDIFLERNNKKIFIEIKNVTLMEDILPNIAQFPDARSGRGEKHLRELIKEIDYPYKLEISEDTAIVGPENNETFDSFKNEIYES